MYERILAEQQDALESLQKEYNEAKERFEIAYKDATDKFVGEASQYRYFNDDTLLSSPPVSRAAYSDRTAWVMASMSQLAYQSFEKDPGALGLFVSKLGSGQFKLVEKFSVKGTQAFLAHNDKYAVLAFRGTESDWRDVQADIRAKREVTDQGKIHSGFYQAYGLVSGSIKDKLPEVKDFPLYITGHSLGGALATVATQDLEQSGFKDQIAACYTFGSPRVGNADFDKNIKSPVYRVINFVDIVTFVPLLTMGFIHVGDERYLDRGLPEQIRRFRPLSQRIYFLLSLLTLLVPAIGAHGIKNYIEKLERIALGNNWDLMMAIAEKENENRKG